MSYTELVFSWEDWLALGLYFVLVLGIGIWASCRSSTGSSQGYFLAGQTSGWILIGCSTFATNIGAHMFVGLAGSGAATGIAVVMYEWHAMFMLIALGWVFLPVYRASGCFTMPQYLQLRFGRQRIRLTIAIIHTLNTIIASISGQMYVGALFIEQVFGWNLYASVIFLLAVTAIYTIMGGLNAVLWTDMFATIILIAGALVTVILGLIEVGGFESMYNQYLTSAANYTYLQTALYDNLSCGWPPEDAFHIFRPATDPSYPWPGMVFGLTILATNAWCTDQVCVQRSLSAKSISHAKGGVLLAAYLKILPFFFFVIPGILSRVMYPDEVACADPDMCESICNNRYGCSDIAYPLLVVYLLPEGLRGLMFAALIAALMSSLTSMFNSSSTLFTLDIWKVSRKKASEKELMIVGRVYTLVLTIVALLWLPILQLVQGSQFWDYIQSIYSHILPPIVSAFLLGLFWSRATEEGAFWGIIIGVFIGLVRLVLDWIQTGPPCGSNEPDDRWKIISDVHYLHFAIILFVVAFTIQICVSFVTKPRPPGKLRRVTFWTRNSVLPQEVSESDVEEDESVSDNEEFEESKHPTGEDVKLTKSDYMKNGQDNKPKKRLTKEEMIALQKKMTNISEEPGIKMFLNYNAILCAAVAVFLHAFWA